MAGVSDSEDDFGIVALQQRIIEQLTSEIRHRDVAAASARGRLASTADTDASGPDGGSGAAEDIDGEDLEAMYSRAVEGLQEDALASKARLRSSTSSSLSGEIARSWTLLCSCSARSRR